ncbi:hypothetical protein GCM10010219_05360 [Streptomyces netropsis]|nr:hypothetical protein GCM10010219_05360 [Streptomyces netropsis]
MRYMPDTVLSTSLAGCTQEEIGGGHDTPSCHACREVLVRKAGGLVDCKSVHEMTVVVDSLLSAVEMRGGRGAQE